ncbi:hypothetical protein GCM10022419_033480 [Nonomuraea rosea]|uniref:Uncharacterized protein n=1 Tax=Nonomuraea rosea TaxID=638574 RepID=A0ABP6WE74_9ACTN
MSTATVIRIAAPTAATPVLIRPWYPAGAIGHTRIDCPDLLKIESTPREGSGWLNPELGQVCIPCLKGDGYPLWDAHCNTCGYSCKDARADDGIYSIFITQDEAITWKREHRCEPAVSLISPTPPPPAQPQGQGALFSVLEVTR